MINYKFEDRGLVIDSDEFSIKHIMECGQAFRWYKEEDESYTLVHKARVLRVREEGNKNILLGVSEKEFKEVWKYYFDLDRSYQTIKEKLNFNEDLKKSTEYGYGIRILNQDIFETVISFIISANNMIPRIKKSVETISTMYGDFIEEDDKRKYYTFPTRNQLAKANPKDLKEFARVGFRDTRIVEASKMMEEENYSDQALMALSTKELRERLIALPGVGPKVSDCIMLFAFARREVFPIDVWIKRVMEELFIGHEVKKSLIASEADKIFGKNAGYAQQYLFYYGRENNIGK